MEQTSLEEQKLEVLGAAADKAIEASETNQQAAPIEEKPEANRDKMSRPSPDESFRELREQRDYERQRRLELEERIRQAEASRQAPPPEEEPEYHIEDTAILEGKDLKKITQQQQLKFDRENKKREAETRQLAELVIKQRLMMKHPDLEEVMSEKNLKKLGEMKPHLARSILSNSDPYDAYLSTYEAIKDYVIKEENKEAELRSQTERIAKNTSKPPPTTAGSAAPASSPLAKAHAYATGLTDDRKRELFEEWKRESGGKYYSYK